MGFSRDGCRPRVGICTIVIRGNRSLDMPLQISDAKLMLIVYNWGRWGMRVNVLQRSEQNEHLKLKNSLKMIGKTMRAVNVPTASA